MKTLSIIMAILVAFVTDYYAPTAAEKTICTAPVVPVCFNQAEPGLSYCITHRQPLTCVCNVTVLSGGMERSCGRPCKAGGYVCGLHDAPPLTEKDTITIHK